MSYQFERHVWTVWPGDVDRVLLLSYTAAPRNTGPQHQQHRTSNSNNNNKIFSTSNNFSQIFLRDQNIFKSDPPVQCVLPAVLKWPRVVAGVLECCLADLRQPWQDRKQKKQPGSGLAGPHWAVLKAPGHSAVTDTAVGCLFGLRDLSWLLIADNVTLN